MTAETKRCKECKTSIIVGAKKCVVCGAFQSRWKSAVHFISIIAGAITLFSGAVVFIVNSYPEFKKVLDWNDDIEVLSYNSLTHISIINIGDGDVYLDTIHTNFEFANRSGSDTQGLANVIKSGEVKRRTLILKGSEPLNIVNILEVYPPMSPQWISIAANAINKVDCFLMQVVDANDASYLQSSEHYAKNGNAKLMTVPHVTEISFYSIKQKKRLRKRVNTIGIVQMDEDCIIARKIKSEEPIVKLEIAR
jgi:hypothetical protein